MSIRRVTGLDSSPDMLARARQRAPGADFAVADQRRLPAAIIWHLRRGGG